MAKPRPEDVKDVLVQNRAAALSYANGVGSGHVRELLAYAEADLLARIESVKGSGTFTESHLNTMLVQVRAVTSQLVEQMTFSFGEASDQMAGLAGAGTLDYMYTADQAFRGQGSQPLALREASVLDEAKQGARASLLRRIAGDPDHPGHAGVLARYGMNTIGEFEKTLRVGVVTRKGIDDVKGDLTNVSPFLQGKPAFWAERIARTELMGAYNRASWEAHREVNEQLGDMVKILSATFDNRTAADSYAVHGQIRRPDEAFDTWYGLMQHPPARPNDREIVIPHRISWEIPKFLLAKSDGEVLARWLFEGRKGAPPPRPEMTTVDLSLFGKEPEEKEEDKETEPTPGMRDAMAKGAMQNEIGDDLLQPDYGPQPITPEVLPEPEPEPIFEPQDPDALLSEYSPGRDEHHVKHGLAHGPKKPFWEGWSAAEQDLISNLLDGLDEKNQTTEVHPADVIHAGSEIPKTSLKYALEDEQTPGMSYAPGLIKKDGLLYAYTGSANAIARVKLGKESMKAIVLDLDDPLVASQLAEKKPKVPTVAADFMATKTGEKKGSNEGGFYKGIDGKERYVKAYSDAAQAHCENIANTIYKDLGLSSPTSTTFEKDGRTYYAHETIEGTTLTKHGLDKKTATKILDGFAADILLGNRDVIGLSKDNVLIKSDGSVHRLDNGGSLLMRAQAGRKKLDDLHTLKEWDGFFNGSVNTYASVLDAAGVKSHKDMKKQILDGVTRIAELQKKVGGWDKYIDTIAPTLNDSDRRSIAQMLTTRTKLLQEKAKLLRKREAKPKEVVLEPGKWGPATPRTFEELLAEKKPRHMFPKDHQKRTPNGKLVGVQDDPGTYRGDAHAALLAHATSEQRSSITRFTGGTYSSIRAAGRMTEEEFRNSGSYGSYSELRKHAENIETAFDSMPEDKRIEGVVFRGMKVPRVVANAMLAQNDKPHLPGLGAMFSTSREIDPAIGFLGNGAGDTHVFMVINQKRGVAIETISSHKSEQEILMSGKTRCRLTDHYVVESAKGGYPPNVLVLHFDEVVDDEQLTGTPAKPKRARKKKEPQP